MEKGIGLDYISEKRWASLRKKVGRAGGRVLLIVHPYYVYHTGEYIQSEGFSEYERVLEKLLKKSKWPIVILEDRRNIPKTGGILRRLKASGILIVPTKEADNTTIKKRTKTETKLDYGQAQLIKCLAEKAGVKSVYVGGMHADQRIDGSIADYERKWLRRKLEKKILQGEKSRFQYSSNTSSSGCAGVTYERLIKSGKFENVRWIPEAKLNWLGKKDTTRPYVNPHDTFPRKMRRPIH